MCSNHNWFEEFVEKEFKLWSNGGTTYTRSYTWSSNTYGPARSQTTTYKYASTNAPVYCTGSFKTPSCYLARTLTASNNDEYISQCRLHEVIITAGMEKLGASAAASPTTCGAKVAGSGYITTGGSGSSHNSSGVTSQQTGARMSRLRLSCSCMLLMIAGCDRR